MRWLFLTAALVFVIGVAGCADEGKVPGDWQIFWIELDLAVVSFVLCWLVVAFSRYVSNRLVLSRKDLMAMMAAPAVPAAPTSKADRPENQPDLAPVHIEGEEDEDTSKKAGKSKARKTGMEQRKRSIHTSISSGSIPDLMPKVPEVIFLLLLPNSLARIPGDTREALRPLPAEESTPSDRLKWSADGNYCDVSTAGSCASEATTTMFRPDALPR